MKLKEQAFAKAFALVGAGGYLACAIGVLFAPQFVLWLFDSWFHGVDLAVLPMKVRSVPNTILGLITFSGVSWVFGYYIAKLYNTFSK